MLSAIMFSHNVLLLIYYVSGRIRRVDAKSLRIVYYRLLILSSETFGWVQADGSSNLS